MDDKICAKGVKQAKKLLTRDDFLACLYDPNKQKIGKGTNFIFDKNSTMINTVHRPRKLINNFYTKFQIQSDHISLRPLTENGIHL